MYGIPGCNNKQKSHTHICGDNSLPHCYFVINIYVESGHRSRMASVIPRVTYILCNNSTSVSY